MIRSLIHAAAVTPSGIIEDATLIINDGVIAAIGNATPIGPTIDLHGAWVVPGFIDLHVHGGGGSSFNTNNPDEVDAAAAFHLKHGTTTLLASLVSESLSNTETAITAVGASTAYASGYIVGVHLEGPFLSHVKPGCHDLEHLITPNRATLTSLLDTVPGLVRTMTVAPELPGANDLITDATGRGVIVAVGHSAASMGEAQHAFDIGARLVSHAHNGMNDVVHREPGIVGAAFADRRIVLELIVDHIHVHDAVVEMAFRGAPGRVALITDAAPAAGQMPGTLSHIGSAAVVVRHDGRITLRDSDVLAGSALTMDQAFRNALSIGLPIVDVVRAASTTPAAILGLSEHTGSISPGKSADLLVLNGHLSVVKVFTHGDEVDLDGDDVVERAS